MAEQRQNKTDLILSEIGHLRDDVTEVKKALFGNGSTGIRIESDRNTQFRIEHTKDHDRFNRIFDNIVAKLIVIFLINGFLTFSIVYAMDKMQ